MLQKNSAAIIQALKPDDVFLDIGGWAHPFNRAILMSIWRRTRPRGFYNRTFAKSNPIPPIGGTGRDVHPDTWIVRDICAKEPYPFKDQELDFVVCSHTLEDIRDPRWVCSEMNRIGKHHRWLIDMDAGSNSIRFLQKFHPIHNWRNSLPKSVLRNLREEETAQWLFWNGSFEFREELIYGEEEQLRERWSAS